MKCLLLCENGLHTKCRYMKIACTKSKLVQKIHEYGILVYACFFLDSLAVSYKFYCSCVLIDWLCVHHFGKFSNIDLLFYYAERQKRISSLSKFGNCL